MFSHGGHILHTERTLGELKVGGKDTCDISYSAAGTGYELARHIYILAQHASIPL